MIDIADYALELLKHIPQEAIDALPTDGAEKHDYYIYGIPEIQIGETP